MIDALTGRREARLPHETAERPAVSGPGHDRRRRHATRSFTLGVIASEFPPEHGGMQEHARGLVESLAREHHIHVFATKGAGFELPDRSVTVHPVMDWELRRDLRHLEAARVDAWITLNAGLAPYGRTLSAPTFAYVHGNDFSRPWLPHPNRPVRFARRLGGEMVVARWRARQIAAGLQAAGWIFANSAFSRDLCAGMYAVPENKMSVVPPGIRHEFFRAGNPQSGSGLRLVTVSRLSANAGRKNIDGVLRAIAVLRREIEITYSVIGDGDDLPRLKSLAAELGLGSNVRFLGAIDTRMVIDEFSRSDVFIMAVKPSDTDVEGFGMVYAEAAASGLPSIGTNSGGIPEVIEDGRTGLLLDDVSAAGIADGLRRFQRRRGDFDRDAIRARAAGFSASRCASMIVDRISAMI